MRFWPSRLVSRRAAGALLFDPDGRLLMVRDRIRREWGYPGGYADGREAAVVACAREVREEVGLALTPDRLIELGTHEWPRPLGQLTFTTFTAALTQSEADAVKLQAIELTAYRWVTPAEVDTLIAPRLRARLGELLATRNGLMSQGRPQ